jgi:hypothetical protein
MCLFGVMLVACGKDKPLTQAIFIEQESGVEPYPVRMLLSDDFLRIDDGDAKDGFVLYDRNKKSIYSVTLEDKRALRIDNQALDLKKPDDIELEVKQLTDAEVPTIAGVQPVQYDYFVKDKLCLHVMAAEGLLSDLQAVLLEYRQVLAAEQAANMDKTPQEMLSDCFLSNEIFHAAERLQKGFPVAIWDEKGYRRVLQSYESIELDTDGLFTLPDDVQAFSLRDVQ